jgi:signal transduction histidine kinase
VRFDSAAVSEAVLNLIDNAAKYSGESRLIRVRAHGDETNVILEVEDRGIGIPESEREKIFEQFYRSKNGQENGGFGLGLFIVKQIMNAHGGVVEVESQIGSGTMVRLIFPVATSHRNEAAIS